MLLVNYSHIFTMIIVINLTECKFVNDFKHTPI